MKSFKDISLSMSEAEYRADGKMHYSTLAKYERGGGFKSIPTLFDKVESPSLLLGSCVDCLLTGSNEEFDETYLVADFPSIGDKELSVVKGLFAIYGTSYNTLDEIPNSIIGGTIEEVGFQPNWKLETRIKVIKERCAEYYKLLRLSEGKTIVSSDMYADALNMVEALRTAPSSKFLFAPNDPFDTNVERLYQLKFAYTFDGIDYSCMADELVVFHDKKLVLPVDLKTSSHTEYEFFKSFIDWNYSLQSRSYARIIRANMDKDEYFKDFKLLNYHFVVCNKKTLTPLVWECPFTHEYGSIFVGKNKQIELRDPFVIAKELKYYLDNLSTVPQGISLSEPNNLETWLNTI